MHVNCRKIVENIANQTNCRKQRRQIVENGADEVRRTGEFDELEFDELGSSTNWGVRRTGVRRTGVRRIVFYG
jgi:hypothetical protein